MKLRFIILEDNKMVLESISELLNERGYEVYPYSSPLICPLQLIPDCRCSENETCADAILSDLDMPGMNGLEFFENQKEKNCKCPNVALMSGNWTQQKLSKARELGCKTFIKPFSADEIFNWLEKIEKNVNSSRKLFDWFGCKDISQHSN